MWDIAEKCMISRRRMKIGVYYLVWLPDINMDVLVDMQEERQPSPVNATKWAGGVWMKIGLLDVDEHNFPNLPLMKLSAWHKYVGHEVEWYQPMFSGHMDMGYMSKVFDFTPNYQYFIDAGMWIGQSENFLHDGIEENLMKKNSKKQELIPLAIVLIICFIIMIQLAFLVIKWFCGLL